MTSSWSWLPNTTGRSGGRCGRTCTPGWQGSRRSDPSRIHTGSRPCPTRWRRFPITGSTPRTSRSASSPPGSTNGGGSRSVGLQRTRTRRTAVEPGFRATRLTIGPAVVRSDAVARAAGVRRPADRGGSGARWGGARRRRAHHRLRDVPSPAPRWGALGDDRRLGAERRGRGSFTRVPDGIGVDAERARRLVRPLRDRRQASARSSTSTAATRCSPSPSFREATRAISPRVQACSPASGAG